MLTVDMWTIDSGMKVPRFVTIKGKRGERKRGEKEREEKEKERKEKERVIQNVPSKAKCASPGLDERKRLIRMGKAMDE